MTKAENHTNQSSDYEFEWEACNFTRVNDLSGFLYGTRVLVHLHDGKHVYFLC